MPTVAEAIVAAVRIGTYTLALILGGLLLEGCFARRSRPSTAVFTSSRSLNGIASWYGPGFDGHRTSSGAIYYQEDLSAASTLFPLGTHLLVTNLANGRSVEVLVNDHGPYVHGRDLDLSHRAAVVLGMVDSGVARVRMNVLSTPPGGPAFGPRYFVQVGSFTDPDNAQRLREQLGRFYDDVRIIEATSDANRYYRVWMGTFVDRVSAEQRALTVSRIGLRPVIITQ
jgi:rare lipoprotein A